MQLSRIFWCAESVVEQDPSILAAQFPRWKTLGSILAFDIDNQEKARAENRFTLPPSQSTGVVEGGAKIPEPNDHMWVLAAWEAFAVLQRRCKGTEQCMRRGCTNEGIKKCGICKEVKYCGEECQKMCVLSSPVLNLENPNNVLAIGSKVTNVCAQKAGWN